MDKLKKIYEDAGNGHFEQDGIRADLDHFAGMRALRLLRKYAAHVDI